MEDQDARGSYDLGVLFVHGIGQQSRGQTLMQFGEPLQRWYQRWLSGRYVSELDEHATFSDALLLSDNPEESALPAHAELRFRWPALDEDRGRWLLAESCWANAFLTPNFRELANWGLKILPWTLTTHFATRVRRAWNIWKDAGAGERLAAAARLALQGLSLFIAFLLFPVLAAILLVVLLLGLIPIPSVRDFAGRLQRSLSGTIGDSFVLLDNPIQEAAIVGQVVRDLSWLVSRNCRRVAVVAHSQGAAVAHGALKKFMAEGEKRKTFAGRDVLFATFGSGLNKLSSIRRERSHGNALVVWASPLGFFLIGVSLLEIIAPTGDEDSVFAFMGVTLGLMFSMMGIVAVWQEQTVKTETLAIDGVKPWFDLFATADPVPNGRIFDSAEKTAELMTTSRVHNFGSTLADHTSYWANEEEFVCQLATMLADHVGLQIDEHRNMDAALRRVASRRRAWRVRWLTVARTVITFLTLVLAMVHWDNLTEFTRGPLEALGRLPLIGEVFEAMGKISPAPQIVGALMIVLVGWLAYYAVYGSWAIWTRGDLGRFFAKRPYRVIDSRFLFFFMVLVAVVATFLLAMSRASGIIPGAVAAIQAWLILGVIVSFLGVGIAFIGAMLGLAWTLVGQLIAWLAKRARGKTQPESDDAEAIKPLFAWHEPRRYWVSVVSLMLLSYPYLAFVAGGTEAEYFASGWFWRFTLIDTISKASRDLPIQDWQWLLAVLVVVVLTTLAAHRGAFSRLAARWQVWEQSGPTVVAQARDMEWAALEPLVRKRLATMQRRLTHLREVLEKLGAGDAANKYGRAFVPATVKEALDVAALLPDGDEDRLTTLKAAAALSPDAALRLADVTEQGDAETEAVLRMHRHQGFWTRRKVERALSKRAG